ncbi:MAG: hypothetical protein K0S54_1187 [Alphaproteobacteria bacterium]|jgi:hypothetical protein|nr:hypothetical protein [Alphaproteobacteria bacterium]
MGRTIARDERVPALKPGLRYTLDRDRGVWLLHTEQGTLLPPPQSTEIMGLMDGTRDVGGIVGHMTESSGRPKSDVEREVHAFFADLEQRGVVVYR